MMMWLAIPALALGIFVGGRLWPRVVYAGMSDEDRCKLQDAQEGYFNQTSRVNELERQIAVMTVARDPAQMSAAAFIAASEIEDIFARGSRSRNDRKNDVAAVVRRHVDDALKGGKPEFI